MRKFIVLLALMLGGGYVQAQGFGLEAGINFGSMTESYGSDLYKFKNHIGIYLGANYEYEISDNMFLHGGLAISQYGGTYTDEDFWTKIKLNYLELPLMFKYAFDMSDQMKGFVIAGPVFAMGLSGTLSGGYDDNFDTEKVKFDGTSGMGHFKPMNNSFRVGGGLNFNNFEGGVYYSMGLSDIAPDVTTIKSSLFSIILGYRFN